jgi:hypothetical protein
MARARQLLSASWLLRGPGQVILIGLVSRLVVFAAAFAGYSLFSLRQTLPSEGVWNIQVPIVNLFSRWDSGWYLQIALNGYPPGNSPIAIQWAWFPLYPITMKAGLILTPWFTSAEAVLVAGFFISNVLFFVSLYLFYKLSQKILLDSRLALLSTFFFCFWPGAFFYSAVYSESLFMTLALSAFYFLEKKQQVQATALGFLAAFARSTGFLIFIPFLVLGVQKRSRTLIAMALLVASPYLLFNLYGYSLTGVFPVQNIVFAGKWATDNLFAQISNTINTINVWYALLFSIEALLIIFPFGMLLFEGWQLRSLKQTLRVEERALKYWAFSAATLIMIIFFSVAFSMERYAIPMLPLYWVCAKTMQKHKKTGILLLLIMASILVAGSILFATWHYYM